MNDDSAAADQRQRVYEQAYRLFEAGLTVGPNERDEWLARQTHVDEDVRQLAKSMLEADDDCADEPSDDGSLIPRTIAQHGVMPKPETGVPEIENYEVIEEIARGGMGIVYKARQLRPNRMAAIKMIRSGRFASSREIDRFMTEAEAAAQLDDEAVVPVYELGAVNGEPFIAMKFIDGEDLETLLKRDQLDRESCLKILLAVCRAVANAHAKGIIHRDLKPSNILVDRTTGRPWITDFGLAKHLDNESDATAAGDVLGTPGYMAPEQAKGDPSAISPATDVYGLGAILYRMLTGRPPIQSDNSSIMETIERILEHDVPSPKSIVGRLPTELDTICMRCLETDPVSRYANAGELADDLQRFFDGEPIHARPLSMVRRINRWIRHRPGLAVTLAAVAVFYIYHLVFQSLQVEPDATFNRVTTIICVGVAVSAWVWQRWLIRTDGAAWVLYAWMTTDVVLLTTYLFYAGGVLGNLRVLYPVVIAGSILRCRTGLVAYATLLTIAAYSLQWVIEIAMTPDDPPKMGAVAPFLIAMAFIGLIQYYSLTRSIGSYESKSAGRVM